MNIVSCQCFQATHRILRRETTIGIHTQLHLLLGIALSDTLDQIQFFQEVDGTNLQFHAMKTLFQFLLQSSQHFIVGAHPHQSVDGNPRFPACKRRIIQFAQAICPSRYCKCLQGDRRRISSCSHLYLMEEVCKCRFQSKSNARIGTNHIIRNTSHLFHQLTDLSQRRLIFRLCITAQIRERSTFAHTFHARNFIRR